MVAADLPEAVASEELDVAGLAGAGAGNVEFGDPAYWEAYYRAAPSQGEETWDWLVDWAQLKHALEPLAGRGAESRVLHLASGSSELPEDMYKSGYLRQTCLDISPAVVAHMAARTAAACPSVRWLVGDVTDLRSVLPDETFDLVVGKSVLDTLVCADQWPLLVAKYLHEVDAVVAAGGVFVSVEFQQPQRMLPWFRHQAFSWSVRLLRLPDSRGKVSGNIVYICEKHEPTAVALKAWQALLQGALVGVAPADVDGV